jgi:hypothetical protein
MALPDVEVVSIRLARVTFVTRKAGPQGGPRYDRLSRAGCATSAAYIPQRNAAVCTGASHSLRCKSSSRLTVIEQPAMSSDVT